MFQMNSLEQNNINKESEINIFVTKSQNNLSKIKCHEKVYTYALHPRVCESKFDH